jgi:uncharacterized protein with HEPN domain
VKDDRVYLRHILDCIARIGEYTGGGRADFDARPMVQDAVIRNHEVVGEAVKNLSEDFRGRYPDVPWSRIAGMRDMLIHHYFGIRLERVWNVVAVELPRLKGQIASLLVGGLP